MTLTDRNNFEKPCFCCLSGLTLVKLHQFSGCFQGVRDRCQLLAVVKKLMQVLLLSLVILAYLVRVWSLETASVDVCLLQ